MCGRYLRRSDKQQIAERFHAGTLGDFPLPPDFNIAPSTFQPIIRELREPGEDGKPAREMVLARWGLIPHFAKSLAEFKAFTTINARAETILKSPTFRLPFERRRCLVPIDGFYEWALISANAPKSANDPKSKSAKKKPFLFTLNKPGPFALAGLWDAWKEPKPAKTSVHTPDTWLQSFTIVTTEANELMSAVHTRMPVILHERDWPRWLDRHSPPEQPPTDLLRPFDSAEMSSASCNPAVGSVKNNGPEMLVCPVDADPPQPPLNSA